MKPIKTSNRAIELQYYIASSQFRSVCPISDRSVHLHDRKESECQWWKERPVNIARLFLRFSKFPILEWTYWILNLEIKKYIYLTRFISLAHLFGKFSLRFLLSRIVALSLSHGNLFVSVEHRIPFWEPELWHLLGRKRFAFVDILGGTEITWQYFEKQSANMGQKHLILPSLDKTIFVSVLVSKKSYEMHYSLTFFCPHVWCWVTQLCSTLLPHGL